MSMFALVASVAVLFGAVSGASATPTAQSARARPVAQHVIVSPRAGQVVRSHLVRIVVRSGNLSGQLSARLNGVGIASGFGRSQRGLRTLVASVSHGLRRGTNVLKVSVRRVGKRTLTATVRFKVRYRGPMVGAGLDRRVVIGKPTMLVGRTGQLAGTRGARPAVRWSMVPVVRIRAAAVSKPLATLSSPAGRTAAFTPRAPGRYVLRLTVGRGKAARSDTVTLTAVPPNPLVSVETMTKKDGQPGIDVGGVFRGAPTPDTAGPWNGIVQVLVLDRASLGFVSNSTYTDTDQLASNLNSLDASKLVIVALQKPAGAGTQPLTGSQTLSQALAPIGVPALGGAKLGGGQLSAIGVKGLSPGDANIDADAAGADMNGYLTPDQYLEYHFISPDRLPFAYPQQAAGCPVGGCDSGYDVRDIDPYTGNLVNDQTFVTNPQPADADQATDQANQMIQFIDRIPNGHVVTIEAATQQPTPGGQYLPPLYRIDGATMDRLTQAVASVGGTRNGFNLTALAAGPATGEPVYSLVGWAGASEGDGAEAAAGVDGVGAEPYLNGVLRRNNRYMFRPVDVGSSGLVPSALQNLVLEAPGSEAWPLTNDPGAMKALAYLAAQDGDGHLGSDPRPDYWTSGISDAEWANIKGNVQSRTYPGDGNGFTHKEFDAAHDELVKELGWVINVHSYMGELSSPFNAQTTLKSWADTKAIAAKVYNAANQPHDQTALRWTQFTSILLKILGPFTQGATAVVAGILDFGVWMAGANPNGGPSGVDLSFAADQLGDKFVNQAVQAQATFASIGTIIVSDYAKLRVIGAFGGCDPSVKGCNKAFSFNEQQRVAAVTALERGVERLAYEKLFPLGFYVMHLNRDTDYRISRSDPPDPTEYRCGLGYHPFYAVTSLDWTWLLHTLDPTNQNNDQYDVFVWAAPPGSSDQHATLAPDKMLTRMFDPVANSNDPGEGGLGISPTHLARIAPPHTWYERGWNKDPCVWPRYQ